MLVANRFSFRVEIDETVAITLARISRLIVANIAKARFLRRYDRIGRDFEFSYLLFPFRTL